MDLPRVGWMEIKALMCVHCIVLLAFRFYLFDKRDKTWMGVYRYTRGVFAAVLMGKEMNLSHDVYGYNIVKTVFLTTIRALCI